MQSVLAPVARAAVRLGPEGLDDARAAVLSTEAAWGRALEAWRALARRGGEGAAEAAAEAAAAEAAAEAAEAAEGASRAGGAAPASFRCSCVRDGPHAFTSVAAAAAVGGEVQRRFGWAPSMKAHELEVLVPLSSPLPAARAAAARSTALATSVLAPTVATDRPSTGGRAHQRQPAPRRRRVRPRHLREHEAADRAAPAAAVLRD